MEKSTVDQVGNKIRKLLRVKHLGHFDISFSETSQSFSTLLDIANLEEKWKFLALTYLVAADLLEQIIQEIRAFCQLEIYRLPVILIEEFLQASESIDDDAPGVHATISALMDGLMT